MQRPASGREDFWIITGASREDQALKAAALRDEVQSQFPTRDPIIVCGARSGATLGDVVTECVEAGLAAYPAAGYFILGNPGGNNVNSSRPYATDAAPNTITTELNAALDAIEAAGKIAYAGAISYRPYDVAPIIVGPDANNDGSKPYNEAQLYPRIAARVARSWIAGVALPATDEYSLFLRGASVYADVAGAETGVHPTSVGAEAGRVVMRREWARTAFSHAYTGAQAATYADHILSTFEPATDAATRTGLIDMCADLPSGATQTAYAARAAAIVTAWTDPVAGWKPTNVAGAVWFDLRDHSTATMEVDYISALAAKGGTATLAQTGTSRPTRRKLIGRSQFGFADGVNDRMTSTDAAIVGMLDAASQPFTIGWVQRDASLASLRRVFGWGTGAADLLSVEVNTNFTIRPLNGSSILITGVAIPTNTWDAFTLLYDGTTLSLRRNGAQISSAAWAKPAWTGTGFALFSRSFTTASPWRGDIATWFATPTALTGDDLASAEAFLSVARGSLS
jgi:hypothetical protein